MASEKAVAVQKATTIRAFLEGQKKQLAMAVPKHLPVDRLLRVAMTSIQQTPKLLDCTPVSLLRCVMTCAQLGLEPDQFLGQAYLVPFWNSKKSQTEAQLIPGYRGYISLARRSGEVQSVSSQVVYTNDHFLLEYGINEKLEHRPVEGDRGKPRGAYVIFKYKDGGYSFDYMSTEDIEKIRERSKAKDSGPWQTDWDEMGKKTVIKRHAKLAPLSVEFQKAVALEDRAYGGESQEGIFNSLNGDVIDAEQGENDIEALAKQFDEATKDEDQDHLKAFLEKSAEHFEMSVSEIKAEVMKDPNGLAKFLKEFRASKPESSDKDPIREQFSVEDLDLYDELKNVRSSSLEVRVIRAEARILRTSPQFQDWLKNTKWKNVYKGAKPYPLDKPESPAEGQIATPGEDSEPDIPIEPDPNLEESPTGNEEGWIDCSHKNIAADRIKVTYCEGGCRFREGCKDYEKYLNKNK